MSQTYFIRSLDRQRILATLTVQQLSDNKLAFAWAITSINEHSPSRREGTEKSIKRLAQVKHEYLNNGFSFTYINSRMRIEQLIIGGVSETNTIVRDLYSSLTGHLIEQYRCKRLPRNREMIDINSLTLNYLDLFCKIRNDFVAGKIK